MATKAKQPTAATKPMAQGVGDSKRFNNPEAFEDAHDWANATIEGQPIEEAVWGRIPWRLTDQGAQELNGGKPPTVRSVEEIIQRHGGQGQSALEKALVAHRHLMAQGLPIPPSIAKTIARARSGAGDDVMNREHDHLRAYRDGLTDDNLVLQEDPLKVGAMLNTPEGMHGMWLSKDQIKTSGWQRGVIQYQPVLDQGGSPVEIGGMILAAVPLETKAAADEIYRQRALDRESMAQEKVQEASEQVMDTGKLNRMMRNRRSHEFTEGLVADDGDAAYNDLSEEGRGALEMET